MTWTHATVWFLVWLAVCNIIAVIGWDMLVWHRHGVDATVSRVLSGACKDYPVIAGIMWAIVAHITW